MKIRHIIILVLIIGLGASICWNLNLRSQLNNIERKTVYDTILVHAPVPKDSVVIKYVTKALPIYDSIALYDTVRVKVYDSIQVVVPIIQKVYEEDNYTAWVSGYLPALDSIHLRIPTYYVTETEKTPWIEWSFGPQIGVGYTPYLKPQPYIGLGVQFGIPFRKFRRR